MAQRTPFYDIHHQAGAKLIDFGGFDMPVQYAGIKVEHHAVRNAVGMFDVSHMGEVFVTGPNALAFIQHITINDASKLVPGKAQYSAMCYPEGGIVDDLLVYMIAEQQYMLVINASNIEKDVAWMRSNNPMNATIEDASSAMCLLAVQGPKSIDTLQKLTSVNLSDIPYYSFKVGDFCGYDNVILSYTGYTGELGFEIYFDGSKADAHSIWHKIMEAGAEHGIQPCGLGARDTLRLEMGFALYGNDISKETHPLEAGLGWLTKLDKDAFIGKEAIQAAKLSGLTRKLVGFVMDDNRAIPRSHYAICTEAGDVIGEVSSGGLGITEDKAIGIGYVAQEHSALGSAIYVQIRNKLSKATVTKPPFIKKK